LPSFTVYDHYCLDWDKFYAESLMIVNDRELGVNAMALSLLLIPELQLMQSMTWMERQLVGGL